MGRLEGLIVDPSRVFPVEGIQSIECPNCYNIIPTGYTLDQLNIASEHTRGMQVICDHCQTEFFIQGEPSL